MTLNRLNHASSTNSMQQTTFSNFVTITANQIKLGFSCESSPVIFLPAHPASFAHNFVSGMQSFHFRESQDAMVLRACHEKQCSGLIILQLVSLIWETASPRTHKPKIVNESL